MFCVKSQADKQLVADVLPKNIVPQIDVNFNPEILAQLSPVPLHKTSLGLGSLGQNLWDKTLWDTMFWGRATGTQTTPISFSNFSLLHNISILLPLIPLHDVPAYTKLCTHKTVTCAFHGMTD